MKDILLRKITSQVSLHNLLSFKSSGYRTTRFNTAIFSIAASARVSHKAKKQPNNWIAFLVPLSIDLSNLRNDIQLINSLKLTSL